MTALDVLLLSSGPAALDDVRADLEAAGHRVLRCHDREATAPFPCSAVADHTCPLDGMGADVALDVRWEAAPEPTAWENGVSCARRADVPLVVAGAIAGQPFGDHASVVIDGTATLVAAVEQAAERDRARKEAAIEAACGSPVSLTREGDRVHVVVADPALRANVAARAGGAARRLAPGATHVTVSFSPPAGG
jgi:hypothetical protein